jgi:hypothetical protein
VRAFNIAPSALWYSSDVRMLRMDHNSQATVGSAVVQELPSKSMLDIEMHWVKSTLRGLNLTQLGVKSHETLLTRPGTLTGSWPSTLSGQTIKISG